MNSFLDVIKNRRSIRRYTKQEVDNALIEKIIEISTYAPTPCNQQLWQFVVIKDDQIKQKLVKEAYSSTLIRRAPAIIVVMYDGWNYKEAIQAGSLATQNILLATTHYKVGALAMNSYGSDKKIKKILNVPDNYQICCFICLGYPEEIYDKTPLVPKRPVKEIISFNRFNSKRSLGCCYDPEKWTVEQIIDYQKYYCRKTFMGKQMDIFNHFEKELVKRVLLKQKPPFLDLLSYDGCYLDLFSGKTYTLDLCEETLQYTKESLAVNKVKNKEIQHLIYNPKKEINVEKIKTSTLIYKAERMPRKELQKLLQKTHASLHQDGKIIIISRRNNLLFSLFYHSIKLVFGDDIRKTGIYAFFGPYQPVRSKELKKILKKAGFQTVKEKRYFLIPPFFDQVLQMYLQYKNSEGSSYLHRIRRENILTKILSSLLRLQGFSKNRFGSVSVIEAKKRSVR